MGRFGAFGFPAFNPRMFCPSFNPRSIGRRRGPSRCGCMGVPATADVHEDEEAAQDKKERWVRCEGPLAVVLRRPDPPPPPGAEGSGIERSGSG